MNRWIDNYDTHLVGQNNDNEDQYLEQKSKNYKFK